MPLVISRSPHYGGEGDLLTLKIYTMPKCMIVEMGMEMYSNCLTKQKHSRFPHLMKLPLCCMKFLCEFNFVDVGVFEFCRKTF